MRPIRFIRVLRTSSSERFVLQRDDQDFAAVDLHFLADSKVAATLIIIATGEISAGEISSLIAEIDETLLPDQDYESGDLMFTIVRGEVEGTFVSERSSGEPV